MWAVSRARNNSSKMNATLFLLALIVSAIGFSLASPPCNASEKCCNALTALENDTAFKNFIGQWAIENARSKDAYNCATDKCVMAFSQALLKHEEPPESCSCNSTWIQLDSLRQHCSKAGNGGTVCPLSEVIVDGQKVLDVNNLFPNCLPNECNNADDLAKFSEQAEQNPGCKTVQRCDLRFNC